MAKWQHQERLIGAVVLWLPLTVRCKNHLPRRWSEVVRQIFEGEQWQYPEGTCCEICGKIIN